MDVVKGHALFRIGSFMNHSCSPNVAAVSPAFSTRAQWCVLKPVALGEELQSSYLSTDDLPTLERRKLLQLHYSFTCECSMCRGTSL